MARVGLVIEILAPAYAENSLVVPVSIRFDEPLVAGDILYIYADNYLAASVQVTDQVLLEQISTRLRLDSGVIETMLIAKDQTFISQSSNVTLTQSNFALPATSDDSNDVRTRITEEADGLALMFKNEMGTGGYLSSFGIATDYGYVDINLTPFVAGNPYFSIDLASPSNFNVFPLEFSSGLPESKVEYDLDIIVDLFGEVFILNSLREIVTPNDHLIVYNDTAYSYESVDPFIMTVARDNEFTEEFSFEIGEAYPSAAGITYAAAIGLLGVAGIDDAILSVAGADGNYVG